MFSSSLNFRNRCLRSLAWPPRPLLGFQSAHLKVFVKCVHARVSQIQGRGLVPSSGSNWVAFERLFLHCYSLLLGFYIGWYCHVFSLPSTEIAFICSPRPKRFELCSVCHHNDFTHYVLSKRLHKIRAWPIYWLYWLASFISRYRPIADILSYICIVVYIVRYARYNFYVYSL